MLRGKTVILQVDAKDLWTNAKFLRDHKTWVRECITFLQKKKSVCVHPRNCISVLLQAKRFLLSWECKSIKKCCTQKHWNYIFPHSFHLRGLHRNPAQVLDVRNMSAQFTENAFCRQPHIYKHLTWKFLRSSKQLVVKLNYIFKF